MTILLLSAPKRSGKTTALRRWMEANPGVRGILSPDTPQGRIFQCWPSGQIIPFESATASAETVSIRRFHFFRAAFDTAGEYLLQAADAPLLVVDEIGPLELRGEGFDPWLRRLMARQQPFKCLWVVREELAEEVTAAYGLPHPHILSPEELLRRPLTDL